MRFTTWHEQGDGADLGYNQLPDDLNQCMMAATGEAKTIGQTEETRDTCVDELSMVSNLPLLFAEGYPTSLEKITMPQLERFITFMVQCSFGHDTAKVTGEPQWWPKEVKFSNPFVRPKKVADDWMGNLKKLVFRCYTYHRSEYLLRFCSHLAQHPRESLQYADNWDSTTSLYHKNTGKLLVTFRNQNMNYDKKIESPRRLLIPRNIGATGSASKTKQSQQQQQHARTMVQPVLCDDIYLCDNCDAEFVGLQKMKTHEKLCCDRDRSSERTRPLSPEATVSGSQPVQSQFLEYFNLLSNDAKGVPPKSVEPTTNGEVPRSSRRMRGCVNLARCPTIPFSSPAGIAMAKKLRTMTEVTQQERLERIERYLIAPVITNLGSRPRWLDRYTEFNRWIVSYKPNKDQPTPNHVHEYKFASYRNKPVLSLRSQILCMACRSASVPITLLTPRQVDELKKNPYKYVRPVRKCSRTEPHSLPSCPENAAPTVSTVLKRKHVDTERISIELGDGESAGTLNPKISTSETSDGHANVLTIAPKAKRIRRSPTETIDTTLNALTITPVNVAPSNNSRIGMNLEVSQAVTVIDLCSSDEEDALNETNTCDENRDPMHGANQNVTASVPATFIPTKISNIYPTNSTREWLNRLTEPCAGVRSTENTDSRANRYGFSDVTYKKRPCYSQALRPTP